MCKGGRIGLIIGGIVLGVIIILTLILGAFGPGWGWGMMGPRMMYGHGGGWIMGIFMLIFWGLVVWGIVALIRYYSRPQQNTTQNDTALEILKRRYARGEINKEEFEEKRKDLL